MTPWQSLAMRVRNGDRTYIPLTRILPPANGACPPRIDDATRPLWLGLHLVSGAPLPPDMAGDKLTARCRAADAWAEIPLVVVGMNGSAVLVPVLLGRLPQPGIDIVDAETWLGPQAQEAADIALRLAGEDACGFLLLPRFAPGHFPLIDGRSLGLPLAAAARRLRLGKPLPDGIVMTGEVDAQGQILPVEHIPEKRACARDGNYPARLFLYPADNDIDGAPAPESLPVRFLDEADTLLDLAEATEAASIARNLPCWRDEPAAFFSWLAITGAVEPVQICLLNLAGRQGWCSACSDEKRVGALRALIAYWPKIEHSATLRRLLTELFPYDEVKDLPTSEGLQALAEKCMTVANHRGVDAGPWRLLNERCLAELQNSRSILNQLAALKAEVGNKIGREHNTFRFLPSSISPDWLEKVNRFDGDWLDENIGKIYGFLTQHYAFCGMYDEAIAYAERSLRHFADERHRGRRFIDRIYLYLDKGSPHEARRELVDLLGKAGADEDIAALVAGQDDEYVHAAFVRLCRCQPQLLTGYPVAEILAGATRDHPWQLWANNCGLLLADKQPELARRCLDFSRGICLGSDSPIILAMALLPLASLYATRLAPEAEVLRQTAETLHSMERHCADNHLYEPHFHPLFTLPDAAAVLAEVAARPKRYFPFNYR